MVLTSDIPLRHIPALLLSLAAHIVMVPVVLLHNDEGHVPASANVAPVRIMTIRIDRFQELPLTSGLARSVLPPLADTSSNMPTTLPAISPAVAVKEAVSVPDKSVESYYFRGADLTEKPQVAHDAIPDPLKLIDVPPQTAVLRLLINEYGDVDKVILEESHFPAETEVAVIEAFSKIKFIPGKIEGAAVKSQLKIEFILDNIFGVP